MSFVPDRRRWRVRTISPGLRCVDHDQATADQAVPNVRPIVANPGTAGARLPEVVQDPVGRITRMSRHANPSRAKRQRWGSSVAAVVTLLSTVLFLVFVGSAQAESTAAVLGTADTFAVLGGQSVTNTGPSVVRGDLGVSPGSSVTGFPPGLVLDGTINVAPATTT